MKNRTAAIIADGSALWLDASGKKLSRRQFVESEVPVRMDLTLPVTVKRLQDIALRFDIRHTIAVHDWRFFHPGTDREITQEEMQNKYAGGEEGGYKTMKKDYHYNVKSKSLVIWDNDTPVYANDNGVICRDLDALADTLM